jgi:hypothetical protein
MVPYIGAIDKPAAGTSLSTIEAQCPMLCESCALGRRAHDSSSAEEFEAIDVIRLPCAPHRSHARLPACRVARRMVQQ